MGATTKSYVVQPLDFFAQWLPVGQDPSKEMIVPWLLSRVYSHKAGWDHDSAKTIGWSDENMLFNILILVHVQMLPL